MAYQALSCIPLKLPYMQRNTACFAETTLTGWQGNCRGSQTTLPTVAPLERGSRALAPSKLTPLLRNSSIQPKWPLVTEAANRRSTQGEKSTWLQHQLQHSAQDQLLPQQKETIAQQIHSCKPARPAYDGHA